MRSYYPLPKHVAIYGIANLVFDDSILPIRITDEIQIRHLSQEERDLIGSNCDTSRINT